MRPDSRALAAQCAARGHGSLTQIAGELEQDLRSYWARSGIIGEAAVTPWRWLSGFADPALACVLVHRLAHWADAHRLPLLPAFLAGCNRLLFRITVSPVSCVGGGWSVRHPAGVHFHGVAGEALTLYAVASCTATDVPVGRSLEHAPVLGSRVRLGANAAVIGPVVVGDDVDIGFRTVVERDLPAGSLAVGESARLQWRREASGLG